MYTHQLPNLYPEYQLAVSLISGQHSICFHKSHTLSNVVPLGFCWVAFPPPPITLRQRSSTCVEPLLASLRRVLSKGCHSFLSKWLEKVSQPSLAEPFGSDSGRMELTVRLSFPSLGRHRPDCRSLFRSRRPQPS